MSVSTVAIAGITGKLGTLIAQAVLTTSNVSIRGLCRDKSKLAPELQAFVDRITIVEGGSTDLSAARHAVRGSQVVICSYLGSDDLMINGQKVLIDACVAESVPRYIASDYSLDYTKLELGALPAKDPMIQIKAYVEGTPVKGVHVLIGCFTETFVHYMGAWDPKQNLLQHWGTGDEVWDFTTYGTSAQYIAAVALDPNAHGLLKCESPSPPSSTLLRVFSLAEVCPVRADHMSLKQVATMLTKLRGQAPTMKSIGPMDELKSKIDAARVKGNVGWDVMPL